MPGEDGGLRGGELSDVLIGERERGGGGGSNEFEFLPGVMMLWFRRLSVNTCVVVGVVISIVGRPMEVSNKRPVSFSPLLISN